MLCNKFSGKVGVHQGSVLSYLLFIIVLEALTRVCRNGSMWELLYVNDLVVIAKSLKELEVSYYASKNSIECKALRVNMKKKKVMASALSQDASFQSGKLSCGVCFKGVGVSSILCTLFNHWVHKRCSGLKSKLASTINFKCKACLDPQVSDVGYKAVDLMEINLGDIISAGGGCFCCFCCIFCCCYCCFCCCCC